MEATTLETTIFEIVGVSMLLISVGFSLLLVRKILEKQEANARFKEKTPTKEEMADYEGRKKQITNHVIFVLVVILTGILSLKMAGY